jgi:hypothetical protein
MRWATAALVGMMLAGCTAAPASAPLWPGPDWRAANATAAEPGGAAAASAATTGRDESAVDESPVKVPKAQVRRGSGTPPDILFGNPQSPQRPEGVQPIPAPAYAPSEPRNTVLAPRDPKAPYSADGFGYQRQGTTILGPSGGTYNQVGPGIFGPNGSSCHVVGNSLFC